MLICIFQEISAVHLNSAKKSYDKIMSNIKFNISWKIYVNASFDFKIIKTFQISNEIINKVIVNEKATLFIGFPCVHR